MMNRAALIQNSESVRNRKLKDGRNNSVSYLGRNVHSSLSPSKSNVTIKSRATAKPKPGMYQPKDELSRKLIALRYGKDAKRPKKINLKKMGLNNVSG